MAFARVVLPSTVTTTRNNLLVGRRTRSKNDGRRHHRAFSASLKSDENDEPIITTIAGKAVAAVVATAVALSVPTRASAEEVVRFCNYPVLWFCSRARTRELFPVRAFSWRGKSLGLVEYLFLSLCARARPRSRPLYHTARVTRERLTVRTRTFLSVSDDKRSD